MCSLPKAKGCLPRREWEPGSPAPLGRPHSPLRGVHTQPAWPSPGGGCRAAAAAGGDGGPGDRWDAAGSGLGKESGCAQRVGSSSLRARVSGS